MGVNILNRITRTLLLLVGVFHLSLLTMAQVEGCTDTTANNYNPGAELDDGLCTYGPLVRVFHELYYEDDGTVDGYPEGFKTWRIYAELGGQSDFVFSLYANAEETFGFGSMDCQIWNHALGGVLGQEILPQLFEANPALAYDSWLTIGLTQDNTNAEVIQAFAGDLESSLLVDGLSPNLAANGEVAIQVTGSIPEFYPDDDQLVLLGQITCLGNPSYSFNIQAWQNGTEVWDYTYLENGADESGPAYGLSHPLFFCSDDEACNFSNCAITDLFDDDQCDYESCVGCTDIEANNYNPSVTIDGGNCTYGPLVKVFHELYYEDDGTVDGYPEGYKTWRIYAELAESDDYLKQIFASVGNGLSDGLIVGGSSCSIWNHPSGGYTGAEIDINLFDEIPALEYDSWLTINIENNSQLTQATIEYEWGPSNFESAFGSQFSENFIAVAGHCGSTDEFGETGIDYLNGFPDDNGHVLLAQLTTSTEPLYYLNLGIFDEPLAPKPIEDFYVHQNPNTGEFANPAYGLSYLTAYCTDPTAVNYSACPVPNYIDNSTCIYEGCTDSTANNYNSQADEEDGSCTYGPLVKIYHETFYEDDGTVDGYPEGATTYRIYAELNNPNDFLSAVFASGTPDLYLGACDGLIWNHPNGSSNGSFPDSDFFDSTPSLEYDSFVTIGTAAASNPLPELVLSPSANEFEESFGTANEWTNTMYLEDGLWFLSGGDAGLPDEENSSVLLAQITTTGTPAYHLNVQVLQDNDPDSIWAYAFQNPEGLQLTGPGYQLSHPTAYCGDEEACIYCPIYPLELEDPDLCEYACAGCLDEEAINYDPEAGVNDPESCIYFDCNEIPLILNLSDTGGNGWEGGQYSIYTFPDNLIASGSLMSGAASSDTLCIPTDCIKIVVNGGDAPNEISWQLTDLEGLELLSGVGDPIAQFISFGGLCEEPGCTNPLASNYDSLALWDDGSCLLDGIGCTDSTALNYDPENTIDDGSCAYGYVGCMDPFAANYWPEASYDPGGLCIWGDYEILIDERTILLDGYLNPWRNIKVGISCDLPSDQLVAVGGQAANALPIWINVENDGILFNDGEGGITAMDINPQQFDNYPNLQYDSRVTIGMSDSGDPGGVLTADPVPETAFEVSFLDNPGQNFQLDSGNWQAAPPFTNAFMGEGPAVDFVQVTSSDGVCGGVNFTIRINENGEPENYTFHDVQYCSWPYNGCSNELAANYSSWSILESEECAFGEYDVLVETIYSDDESIPGYPEGYSTYRIYATCENDNDILSRIFADPLINPIEISTSGQFWNHPEAGAMATDIPAGTLPSSLLYYDSYWSIGVEDDSNPDALVLDQVEALAVFGTEALASAVLDYMYLEPADIYQPQSLGGTLQKVLIAQVTTNGAVCGSVNAQWLIESDPNAKAHVYDIDFCGPAVLGCMDPIANNYNSAATVDDATCTYDPCSVEEVSLEWTCIDEGEGEWTSGFTIFSLSSSLCSEWSVQFTRTDIVELPVIIDLDVEGIAMESGVSYFVPLELADCGFYDVLVSNDNIDIGLPSIIPICGGEVGCTDPCASNFDALNICDDGSCIYDECCALSLDATWICQYLEPEDSTQAGVEITATWIGPCDAETVCLINEEPFEQICTNLSDFDLQLETGTPLFIPINVPTEAEFLLQIFVTVGQFSQSTTLDVFPCIAGCMDPLALNYDPDAVINGEECDYPCLLSEVELTISTGQFASEMSWAIHDEVGLTVLYSDGNFPAFIDTSYTFCIPNDCYRISMYDSWGDGWDSGQYSISVGGIPAATGSLEAGYESFDFFEANATCVEVDGCTDTAAENYDPLATIDDGSCEYDSIEPPDGDVDFQDDGGLRPTFVADEGGDGFSDIYLENTTSAMVYMYVYNTIGQVVDFDSQELEEGGGIVGLDLTALPDGVYYIQLIHAGKSATLAMRKL